MIMHNPDINEHEYQPMALPFINGIVINNKHDNRPYNDYILAKMYFQANMLQVLFWVFIFMESMDGINRRII